ncbi:MAG: tRNA pseudouridine(38-40) synthase TruA [Lachnospiraceae bacterium]
MNNYRMLLEYDGGRYDGWQRLGKDESSNTVESKLVEVLTRMTGEKIELFCGSRTEKGVHANGQVANFKTEVSLRDYEVRNYLNRYLPRDIAVLEVSSVDERFHSQLNARSKTYLYKIDTNDIASVFERKYKFHSFEKLDVQAMEAAAKKLCGRHDFRNFSTAKKSRTTVKNIESIKIYDDGNEISIYVTADDFLHNMARMVVGVLLEAGKKQREISDIDRIFEGTCDGPVPADPCGLYLDSICY